MGRSTHPAEEQEQQWRNSWPFARDTRCTPKIKETKVRGESHQDAGARLLALGLFCIAPSFSSKQIFGVAITKPRSRVAGRILVRLAVKGKGPATLHWWRAYSAEAEGICIIDRQEAGSS